MVTVGHQAVYAANRMRQGARMIEFRMFAEEAMDEARRFAEAGDRDRAIDAARGSMIWLYLASMIAASRAKERGR